jgi:hypothetical protein
MAYIVGIDLGQAQDYSALAIVEQVLQPPAQPLYEVRWLYRWELGTPYPRMLRGLAATLARPPLVGRQTLLVDHTGCGRPIVDTIRQQGLACQAVSLHGGDTVSHTGSNWRVPKRDLAGAVQVLLQQARLRFAEALPFTPVLTQELLNFRVKIDPQTAHDSYSAWREKDHDDLVLALALACWWGEKEQLSRVPFVDLSKGIVLRRHSEGPRLHQGRVWAEDYEDL